MADLDHLDYDRNVIGTNQSAVPSAPSTSSVRVKIELSARLM